MKGIHLIVILCGLVLPTLIGCESNNLHLSYDEICNRSAIEVIEIPDAYYNDTTYITFHENGFYSRQGDTYLQDKGKFRIENDTLKVYYSCSDDNGESRCGVQKYVLKGDSRLHLTFVRDIDGTVYDLSKVGFGKLLEFIDSIRIDSPAGDSK